MQEVQFRIDKDGHSPWFNKPTNSGLQSVPCNWHALRTETLLLEVGESNVNSCRVGLVSRRSHILVSSKIMLFHIGITITHCSVGTPRS
jgi:hypothetical protein